MSSCKCSIYDCPQNEYGECELAKYPEGHYKKVTVSKCAHKKFKERKK